MEHRCKEGVSIVIDLFASEKVIDRAITLAIERREEENQQTQSQCRDTPAQIGGLDGFDFVFQPERGPCEINGAGGTKQSQYDVERDIVHRERHQITLEGRSVAQKDIGHHGCRHSGQQQRQDGRHRYVEEQYLQSEKHSCQRGLENAGHCPCGSASEQDGHILI